MDSVSVATSFKKKLAEKGIIFCSMSEAIQEHPHLVKKYLGSVVPVRDNFLLIFLLLYYFSMNVIVIVDIIRAAI